MDLDLYNPRFIQDPYQSYRELHTAGPIHFLKRENFWLVTGYSTAIAVLRSPERFSSQINAQFDPVLLGADPPQHTERRRALDGTNQAFSKSRIEALRPNIQRRCVELLESSIVRPKVPYDFVEKYSSRVPTLVILDLLGIDQAKGAELREWTTQAVSNHEPSFIERHSAKLLAFFEQQLGSVSAQVGGGLLRELADAGEGIFSKADVLRLAKVLLVGGNETAAHLISSALAILLQDSSLMERVREDGSVLAAVIQETLRYEPPVQIVHRVAKGDHELGGAKIKSGEMIAVCIGAANRDPMQFPNPDRFDLSRGDHSAIPFGFGPHHCIGAMLARIEAEVALAEFLLRFSRIAPAKAPLKLEYQGTPNLRGIKELHLKLQ